MCQHCLDGLVVPGGALWVFGAGACWGHAVSPAVAVGWPSPQSMTTLPSGMSLCVSEGMSLASSSKARGLLGVAACEQ